MYEILTWFAAWDSHAALQSRSHVIIIQFCNQDYLLHNQHYIFHEVAFFSRRSIILLCPAVRYWSALLQFITFRKPSRMQQLACSSFNNLANICCSFEKKLSVFSRKNLLPFSWHENRFPSCNLSIKREFLATQCRVSEHPPLYKKKHCTCSRVSHLVKIFYQFSGGRREHWKWQNVITLTQCTVNNM